jgi:ABC-type nitrate/sulfonate/bicarbonate transport system permease component
VSRSAAAAAPVPYSRARRIAFGLALPLAALAAWELSARFGEVPSYLIAPTVIAETVWEMFVSGELWQHTSASLLRALGGYVIGGFFGVAMGLLAGIARPVERFYDPLVSLTYPVPKIVVLPILIAWLGAGDASKIAIITAAVFYPTFINALYGAKGVNRIYVWSARNMGASRPQVFAKVILPAALPQVLGGLRIALALAFIVMVATEMQNSRNGLGHLVITAEDHLRFDLMYAAIVAVGVIGFAGDRVLVALRRRALAGQTLGKEGAHG